MGLLSAITGKKEPLHPTVDACKRIREGMERRELQFNKVNKLYEEDNITEQEFKKETMQFTEDMKVFLDAMMAELRELRVGETIQRRGRIRGTVPETRILKREDFEIRKMVTQISERIELYRSSGEKYLLKSIEKDLKSLQEILMVCEGDSKKRGQEELVKLTTTLTELKKAA